jgi:hypothetical protein
MEVRIHEPDRMSLPGLLAAGLLERRLAGARLRVRGDVVLDISGARVTLRFGDGVVEVTREPAVDPIAELVGNYAALIDLAAGHRLRALRTGMRVRARPGVLLALTPLLRTR